MANTSTGILSKADGFISDATTKWPRKVEKFFGRVSKRSQEIADSASASVTKSRALVRSRPLIGIGLAALGGALLGAAYVGFSKSRKKEMAAKALEAVKHSVH